METELTTGSKETYTGITDGTIRDRIARQLPPPPPTRNEALRPRVEAKGQGVALHHHLANIVESQQLQPLVRALSLVPEGKVFHHVQASHRHPQQEE